MDEFVEKNSYFDRVMKNQDNQSITNEVDTQGKVFVIRNSNAVAPTTNNISSDKIVQVVDDHDPEQKLYSQKITSLFICLLKKVDELYHSCNFEEAKSILEYLLPLSWELPIYLGNFEGIICQYLGAILYVQYRPDAAMYLHYKDLELSRASKDARSVAKAYGNIGLCLLCSRYYKFASAYFQEQAIICELINDQHDLARAYGNLGITYAEMKETEKAIVNFSMSIILGETLQDKKVIGISSGKLSLSLQYLGKFEDAVKNYYICFRNSIEVGDMKGACCAKSNIASCLRSLGKYNEAIIASKECIEIQNTLFDESDLGIFIETVNMANSYFEIEDYQKCLETSINAVARIALLRKNHNQIELYYLRDKERLAYSWMIISQIKLGLHLESLLTCEVVRQRNFLDYTGQEKTASIDQSSFSLDEIRHAINDLKVGSLYYQIISTKQNTSTAIIWLIFPSGKRNNNVDIEIHTNIVDLTNFHGQSIANVKSWVFQLRQMIGLRGWKTVHQTSQEFITSKIQTNNSMLEKYDNIWEKLSQMFILKLYKNVFGSLLEILSGFLVTVGMILLSLSFLPSQLYFILSLFSIFDGVSTDSMNIMRGKRRRINHTKLIQKLHRKYSPQFMEEGFTLPNSYTIIACKEFYNVLFRPFEKKIQEVLSEGDTLLLLPHDVMTLVPFQAMMDSEEIYLISKYKLQQSPSLLLAWQLQQRSRFKRGGIQLSASARFQPNSHRLIQAVHIGGKTVVPNRPQYNMTACDEFTVVNNLLHRQNIQFKSFISKNGPNIEGSCDVIFIVINIIAIVVMILLL